MLMLMSFLEQTEACLFPLLPRAHMQISTCTNLSNPIAFPASPTRGTIG